LFTGVRRKGYSPKSISSMLHSPVPLRADNGTFPTLHLLVRHKILEQ
jgi:hypothetical protein